jgi:uncharacterized ferritin-like protein (DUF455 family)
MLTGAMPVKMCDFIYTSIAISLSFDGRWRFAGMPEQYDRDWLKVAAEEA